jgi:mRNA interferase RelE/StbE
MIVKWSEKALHDLEKIDKPIVQRIIKKIDWTFNNFDQIIPEKLSANLSGYYKIRIGDYRVIYLIENDIIIIIQAVGHRREIYNM